ncbi:DUF1796 family putative cysteine peptidase [Ketogulonicigenium vulgare]|nr:DUF1796 family putative cysteine peptidase [Ketogulonicigenium vulgare]
MDLDSIVNEKFNANTAEEQLRRLIGQWSSLNSHKGLALSRTDMYELYSMRERSVSLLDQAFSRMIDEAKIRHDNFKHHADWKYISLGEDCFVRSLATRWGFKKSAALGAKSGPFDLAVHPPAALLSILQNDFDGYMDPSNLKYIGNMKYCMNTRYRSVFNHEVGPEYAENDFEKLRNVITPRVERFRADFEDDGKVCYIVRIHKADDEKWHKTAELLQFIRDKSAARNLALICVSTREHGAQHICAPKVIGESGIHVVEHAYPHEKYVWHVNNRSDAGLSFEREVVRQLRAVMDRIAA